MGNSKKVAASALSLAEGGGVINGMGKALVMPGLMVRYLSLPLTVSAGRGFVNVAIAELQQQCSKRAFRYWLATVFKLCLFSLYNSLLASAYGAFFERGHE